MDAHVEVPPGAALDLDAIEARLLQTGMASRQRSLLIDAPALIAEVKRLRAALEAQPPQAPQKEPTIEDAFKGGYHCQWLREVNRYIFDPALKPGDSIGAFEAWRDAWDLHRARAEGRRAQEPPK